MAPIIARYTSTPVYTGLNQFQFLLSDITQLSFQQLATDNVILDMLNDPQPAAGLRYEFRIFKNGLDTGRAMFSDSLNPNSAGRMSVGPLSVSAGQLSISCAQRLGALTINSVIVKFAKGY